MADLPSWLLAWQTACHPGHECSGGLHHSAGHRAESARQSVASDAQGVRLLKRFHRPAFLSSNILSLCKLMGKQIWTGFLRPEQTRRHSCGGHRLAEEAVEFSKRFGWEFFIFGLSASFGLSLARGCLHCRRPHVGLGLAQVRLRPREGSEQAAVGGSLSLIKALNRGSSTRLVCFCV